MRFAIYSRKSKFTGKGESIDNQIEMCKDYISIHFPNEEHNITVYEDEGFSGKNLNRPQFQKMMKDEQTKPYDFIVVYRLDRISRNVGDFATLIDELNGFKTSFICIKEQFDTSTPMGRAMMNIAAVFAQLERETIAERIKDNMYMLAKEGRWTGGTTPLGYKSVKQMYQNSDKNKSYYVLEFDNEQINLVKLIFKKYKEIQSVNGVETFLRENGYKTRTNKNWDKSNLKRILTNPIYCIADIESLEYFEKLGCNICFTINDCNGENGLLPYNRYAGQKREQQSPDKWVITVSNHKGILTGKEWIDIQKIIMSNSKKYFGDKPATRRSLNPNSVLSGVLYCSCGAYMRPKIYGSGTMYYLCERKEKTKKKECDICNINGDELDKIVLNELFSFDVEGNSINSQINKLKGKLNDIDDELSTAIKQLENKVSENERRINNLTFVISQSIEMNTPQDVIKIYNEQMSDLIEQNKNINLRIEDMSNADIFKTDISKNINNMTEAITYLKQNFEKLSIQTRRDFIKKIVERIVWDGENIHIFIKGVSE